MRRAVADTGLDLSRMTVLTEAASGAYGVTAVIAALAGARRVQALARASRYGSVAEVTGWVMQLAGAAGVADRIEIIQEVSSDLLGGVDIVTNSGHLRPLTAAVVDRLPATAVIALMFEAWEFRAADIDLDACRRRGIPVAAVNENHPAVDVFSYLGPLCVRQLHDCGLAVYRNRIALVCDNGFSEPIRRGLAGLGAQVEPFDGVAAVPAGAWDAIVIALRPAAEPRVGARELQHVAAVAPGDCVLVQFWGDVDRAAALACGVTVHPAQAPTPGHMAVLLSEIGPEPIVRLQAGGLRAAEWVRRGGAVLPGGFAELVG